jgi:biopolymer transport protein ExbD
MNSRAHSDSRPPMGEINTTPLIDVLLVLLIMFIITIPLQTHAVKVDLPSGVGPIIDPVKNKLIIQPDGAILWNGDAVDRATLRRYLSVVAGMKRAPELHLQPHPEARYEIVDEVLAMIKRANVQTMGFVGNEAYATW